MSKISVIISIYNNESSLRKCLDSVINQTFKDIEIICVDNGSTDNSGKILDEYVKKDKRIILIFQNKQNLNNAKNIGLEFAKGEYIFFLVSNEHLEIDALEKFYNFEAKSGL